MVEQTVEEHPFLHVISYLDWEREGTRTFDVQRAELLHVLAGILQQMDPAQQPDFTLEYVLLSGQTILLEDIAAIRTSLHTSLVISNAGGRIGMGPFYVRMDGMLADGEALIRNLLSGRADVRQHGIRLMNIAYLPDGHLQSAQMPQILHSFGIDAALVGSMQPVMPLPFRWEAPDGSAVLVVNYTHNPDPYQSVQTQREGQPDGPFIWLNRLNPAGQQTLADIAGKIALPVQQSMLDQYVASVREQFPDELRPRLRGELALERTPTGPHRFSARLNQKRDAAMLLNHLLHGAEPLLALAAVFGKVPSLEIERALLDYSWRLYFQSQTPRITAGAISDEVQAEIGIRNRRALDTARQVTENALAALPGQPMPASQRPSGREETFVVVWNPHGHMVRQVVDVALNLVGKLYPQVLISPAGEELAFTWHAEDKRISFRAEVPPVGYAVYTLKLSQEETAEYNLPRTAPGSTIGSASGESLGLFAGRIDWSFEGETLTDLITYSDGGDAGTVWQYLKPQTDVIVNDSIVDVAQTELTPTYERLTYRSRMRLAPGLKPGMIRERGLRVLDLTTTFTYFHDLPGIHVQTTFNNSAEDHRLRAHIRTGIDAHSLYTDGAYIVNSRPLSGGIQPAHSFVAVEDHQRGFAIFTRGLPEYEAMRENDQTTIMLTLLRAVGWLDPERKIYANGAQMPGDQLAEFMLLPLAQPPDPAGLMRMAQAYQAPLIAAQYSEKPPHNQHSYLTIESEQVVLTAVKPPQEGAGMVVRVLNPGSAAATFRLQSPGLKRVIRANLAEEQHEECRMEQGGVQISARPAEIITLQLLY